MMNYNADQARVADKISNGENLNAKEHNIAYHMALHNTITNEHRYGWNNYKMFGRRNKEI